MDAKSKLSILEDVFYKSHGMLYSIRVINLFRNIWIKYIFEIIIL
jgi:hypothetical protein